METIFIIIALSLLILAHEAGHFFSAKFFKVRVDEFGIGFPPRIFGKKIKGTLYSINALPFGGFVKIFGEDSEDSGSSGREEGSLGFSDISIIKRAIVLLGGIFMNIVAGWILFSVVFMIGVPFHLAVNGVAKDSPAFESGILAGDIILSASYGDNSIYDPITIDVFKKFIEDAGENNVDIVIRRGTDIHTITSHGRLSPPEGQGSLGVSISMTGVPRQGFFSAFSEGARETTSMLGLIVSSFYDFFSNIFSSPESAKNIAGPVGIVMIAKQVSDLGFVFFIQLLALISLQLAIFNLIPFPALDGGRVLLLMYEAVFRSPVSRSVQTFINAGGLIILLGLMVFATFQDIGRFF